MKELIEYLKEQRTKQTEAKDKYNKAFEQFREQQKSTLEDIENCNLVIGGLTTDIKAEALTEYEKTGNKKLEFGVGIRVMSKMNYDPIKAFDWAKEHQLAIMLDKKSFEKHAKADELDFVEISEVATATIPMKL